MILAETSILKSFFTLNEEDYIVEAIIVFKD